MSSSINRRNWSTPKLSTARLELRELSEDDAADVFAYKSDEKTPNFPRVRRHADVSETRRFIVNYLQKPSLVWALVLRSEDVVIGTLSLSAMKGETMLDHRAEIACGLSPRYWRRGLMTEARVAVLNWAFRSIQSLERIQSEIAFENCASTEMNLKMGFCEDGVLRSYERGEGETFVNIRILSLLREDWANHPIFAEEGVK